MCILAIIFIVLPGYLWWKFVREGASKYDYIFPDPDNEDVESADIEGAEYLELK